MLMLLRVTPNALDPGIVLAHFLRPYPYHGVWHVVGSAQRVQIGGGFLDRRRVKIALAGYTRVAAFVPIGRLFQQEHLRACLACGDGRRGARRPETDYHYICLSVPCRWQPRLFCHVSSLDDVSLLPRSL